MRICLAAAVVSASLLFAAQAAAEDTPYIVTSGPGLGALIKVPDSLKYKDGPTRSRAEIFPPHDRCKFQHLHGRLYNKPDPDPLGCGWGAVVQQAQLPVVNQYLAQAITKELDADVELKKGKSADLADALGTARHGLTGLIFVRDEIDKLVKDGKLDANKAKAIKKDIKQAEDLDADVKKDIKKAEDAEDGSKAQAHERHVAAKTIEKAIKIKREVWAELPAGTLPTTGIDTTIGPPVIK